MKTGWGWAEPRGWGWAGVTGAWATPCGMRCVQGQGATWVHLPSSLGHPFEGPLSSLCRLVSTLVGGLACRCPLRLCRWSQAVSKETVVFFTRDPIIQKRY